MGGNVLVQAFAFSVPYIHSPLPSPSSPTKSNHSHCQAARRRLNKGALLLQERLEAQRLAIACASGLEGGEVREGVEVLEVDGLTVYVAKRGCKGRWVGLAGTGGFAQGEVVIGKVKGHSWWPVMITSLEDAVNEGGCTKVLHPPLKEEEVLRLSRGRRPDKTRPQAWQT